MPRSRPPYPPELRRQMVELARLGYLAVNHVDASRSKARYEARMEMRLDLFDTITLERWWYVPDEAKPEAIGVVIAVEHSGRFAARVHGRTAAPDRYGVYHGEMKPQKQVEAGETVEYEFPLKYYSDESAPEVAFTFMLFRDRTGSAPENVIKANAQSPQRSDDGERFYGALPPTSAPPPRAPVAGPGVRR